MLDTSREPHCIHKSYLSHFQSDLLPIHVPWLWGWLHVESWAGVWSCCEGHCPGMLSLFVPGSRLSLLATGAGSARIECCTAVQQRISQVPLPHRAAWALLEQQDCLLAAAMGRGSGCRTGNLLNTLNLAALPPRGQLFLGKQAQMPRCTPQSSQAMFFIAPGARGELRIKAVVPNSLLLLHLLAASAHLIDFIGIKFRLMPSNIAYFERGKPDTVFCGVTPFVEECRMKSGWSSSELCVTAIESSCTCQSYYLLINFTLSKFLRVTDRLLHITKRGDFVDSEQTFAFSVSFSSLL